MADVVLGSSAALAALQGYLKEDYTIHGLTDSINREAAFFGKCRRSSKEVRGKYGVIPVLLQGNRPAVGARDELDQLPTPAFQKTAYDDGNSERQAGRINMRFNTGRFAITEASIQASATSAGAFESALEVEMKGLTMDMANNLNRQFIAGDGTGKLCTVSTGGAVAADAISVEAPGGVAVYPAASDVDGAKYIEVGDIIAVYNGDTERGQFQVESVDYSSTPNVVTFITGHADIDDGDDFYFAGKLNTSYTTGDDDAKGHEVQGLTLWVDDTSVAGNIDPGDPGNERWVSTVVDHTASPVSLNESILHQTQSLIRRRAGAAADSSLVHWTTYALENDYGVRVLTPDKRYTNTTTLAGGYTALTFAGRPIMVDKDCLPGHWYMLSMSELYCYNQGGFYWMDRDNLFSRTPDMMGWEATLLFYANFGTPRRNAHGVIKGLKEPYRVDQFNSV